MFHRHFFRSLLLSMLVFALESCLGFLPRCNAATVYLKGKSQPVYGTLLKKTSNNLAIRVADSGAAGTKDIVIPLVEIDEVFEPISLPRLEKLDPAQPDAYRLYAEELAEHRKDPEAAAMAIDLFLRSAILDKGPGRDSALRGLVASARNAGERRTFAAAALAVSPTLPLKLLEDSSRSKLTTSGTTEEPTAGGGVPTRERLLLFIQSVRMGRGPGLSPQGQTLLDQFPPHLLPGQLTLEQLAAVAKKATRPTGTTLRELLLIEARLEQEDEVNSHRPQEGNSLGFAAGSWETGALSKHRFQPIPTSLQDLTSSDLLATVFRQGKWTRP